MTYPLQTAEQARNMVTALRLAGYESEATVDPKGVTLTLRPPFLGRTAAVRLANRLFQQQLDIARDGAR